MHIYNQYHVEVVIPTHEQCDMLPIFTHHGFLPLLEPVVSLKFVFWCPC